MPSAVPAVRYTTRGSYDADAEATVAPDGTWTLEAGSYVTHGRRERSLTPPERQALAALVDALRAVPDPPPPPDEAAFASELRVGARVWRWAGPPPHPALAALAAWLAAPSG